MSDRAHPEPEADLEAQLSRLQDEVEELRAVQKALTAKLRRLQILSDRAADSVILHDGQGHIIEANVTAWTTLGYTREEYLTLNIRDLDDAVAAIPPERFGRNWERMTPTQATRVETTQRTKDGRQIPMEIRVTVFQPEEGERLYVAACRDISERVAAEEARKRAEHQRQEVLDRLEVLVTERTSQLTEINARLRSEVAERRRAEVLLHEAKVAAEEANRAKSQFLASMSHELRTPLNAVIGYAEMLQEDAEDIGHPQLIPDLQKIRGAGRHLLGIINDILDLSKVEAGKMDLSLEEVELAPLIEDVISTIRPLAEANENRLEVRLEAGLGSAHTDVTRVRQVLFNLLSNACKFTEQGVVTLAAQRVANDAGERVRFTIEDTGIGMSDQQLERLFTPFTQADASTTRKYGGTGLGLSISERLCRMLGGKLSVQSVMGRGSSFRVELPVEAPTHRSSIPPRPVAQDLEKPLVLVVDDDESAQDLLRRMLEKDGYGVLCASSGPEALRLARVHKPRAITLDVIMPSMDGWAVLSALKADPQLRDVPVVLVTMVSDRQLGFSLGASDFIGKPVDRGLLLRVLDRYRCDDPPCSVLIVDDDPNARALMRRALESDRWRVEEAENGLVALELMAKQRPGVVLLDLMMPELDGFGVLEAMQEDVVLSRVPVIVITAADLTDEHKQVLARRSAHVMRKGQREHESLIAQVRARVAACVNRER